jgi:methionyl-tRNA formyltransferase
MAYTMLGGEPFRILQARALPNSTPNSVIGTVITSDNRVLVGTSAGSLELLEVQPASKNAMQALDWARGRLGDVVFE